MLIFSSKERLSSLQTNSVVSMAVGDAEVHGFVDPFVFERAVAVYGAILFMEEDKAGETRAKIEESGILAAYDTLVEDGTLSSIYEAHGDAFNVLMDDAEATYDAYVKYAQSIRGAVDSLQDYGQGIIDEAMKKMTSMLESPAYKQVMEKAQELGFQG